MTATNEVWATCPKCTRRILLARVNVPVTVAAGRLWWDLSQVRSALALHQRTCPA